MKRFYLFLLLVACSLWAVAQQKQKQMLWFNSKLIHTSTIQVEDSAILGTVWETDTVQLVIPHALVQIVRDTIVVHDTIVKVVHDTINHYYTKQIRDTLVVNNYIGIDAAIAKKYQGIHYFSVGDKKRVIFSLGNLQYNASKMQWRFAEKQYDIIGNENANIGPRNQNWIDLFGWGTPIPTNNSTVLNAYGKFIEWGNYEIGLDKSKTWRTLTQEEWVYLLEGRPNAPALCGMAQVAGVNGLIILPDLWVTPATVVFKSGVCEESGKKSFAKHQSLTAEQWELMEQAGAIFLPAAGYRYGSEVLFVGTIGRYWSSTLGTVESTAAALFYYDIELSPQNFDSCCRGLSVRLVKDI